DVAGVIDAPVGDRVRAVGGEHERAGVRLRGAAVHRVVGGGHAGQALLVVRRQGDGHRAGVPAAGVLHRAGGRRRRDGRGPVDLDAVDGGGGAVAGPVRHAGRGGQVVALAGDGRVGRGGGDARQGVAYCPVDGDVAVVPAGGVGRRG